MTAEKAIVGFQNSLSTSQREEKKAYVYGKLPYFTNTLQRGCGKTRT